MPCRSAAPLVATFWPIAARPPITVGPSQPGLGWAATPTGLSTTTMSSSSYRTVSPATGPRPTRAPGAGRGRARSPGRRRHPAPQPAAAGQPVPLAAPPAVDDHVAGVGDLGRR